MYPIYARHTENMAKVNICNVVVKDNPCPFLRSFQFEITFECVEDLDDGKI